MKTIVITGGTDGMGAALARHYLLAGARVVVIGRAQAKYERLLTSLDNPAAAKRAEFVPADLSLVADNLRVVTYLNDRFDRIDALLLAASFIRQRRCVTTEGHEASWVLFFVSRFLFVTGLSGQLLAAERPVIVNTSVPGARADDIDFDDLELATSFTFAKSNAQQRRANELLGILATRDNPRLGYVTWGPKGLVRTSFAGDIGIGMKAAAAILGPLIGQSPDTAVGPIINIVDSPVPGRTAYRGSKPHLLTIDVDDERNAGRLAEVIKRSFVVDERERR